MGNIHCTGNDQNKDLFVFTHITPRDVVNEILHLNVSTACPKDSIPSHVMKDNIDIFSLKLRIDFNHSIEEGYFPSNLKNADVTPIHKKGDRTDKSTYRPVSILQAMSKIMERLILQQLHTFCDNILSKYQCGFRKHFSYQQVSNSDARKVETNVRYIAREFQLLC